MSTPSVRHANAPLLRALGASIRTLRKARGLSQEELAHACGIERSYMSGIERGQQHFHAAPPPYKAKIDERTGVFSGLPLKAFLQSEIRHDAGADRNANRFISYSWQTTKRIFLTL